MNIEFEGKPSYPVNIEDPKSANSEIDININDCPILKKPYFISP